MHGMRAGKYDTLRAEYLKAHKIEVVRFWNNDILQNIKGVLTRIEEKIISSNLPLKQL